MPQQKLLGAVEIEAALRQGRPRNLACRRIKRGRDGRGADRRRPGTGIRC